MVVITVQDYDEIRRRFNAGESQRHIAKSLGISRNTVKKYCEGNDHARKIAHTGNMKRCKIVTRVEVEGRFAILNA